MESYKMTYEKGIKEDQNTLPSEINILKNPNTETIIFRYILAASFCKKKITLDAATGYGHGMGILKALGAGKLIGFDVDDVALDYINNKKLGIGVHWDLIKKDKGTGYQNYFESVVSIETFEHLPPEKIDTYLQNLKHWCRHDGIIFITTPRRKPHEWHYNGGTHLYEYSVEEFNEILQRNFKNSSIQYVGIEEVRIGEYSQLVSILNTNLFKSDIMCGIIKLNKNDKE